MGLLRVHLPFMSGMWRPVDRFDSGGVVAPYADSASLAREDTPAVPLPPWAGEHALLHCACDTHTLPVDRGERLHDMSELARRVGMSAPAVTERVHRLEAAGVITGFRVDVDPAALGMPVTALVRVRLTVLAGDPVALDHPRCLPRDLDDHVQLAGT
jgi:hypothetical protein